MLFAKKIKQKYLVLARTSYNYVVKLFALLALARQKK